MIPEVGMLDFSSMENENGRKVNIKYGRIDIKSVKWETCEEMEYPTSDELKYVTADVSFTPTQNDLELLGVDSAAEYPVFVNSRDKKNIILRKPPN